MSHRNAPLTATGRLRLARATVEQGWSLRQAAQRFNVSTTTAKRWTDRYRAAGAAGMQDRSSRPGRHPHQLSTRLEHRIMGLRVSRRWGPARIAHHLHLATSTVHRVLRRYHAPALAWIDPMTGVNLRAQTRVVTRYEHDTCGHLIHMDIKKLARIPPGGGHRVHGTAKGWATKRGTKPGWAYLHHAMDDHSRLVYSEILTDERKETVAAFWARAVNYYTTCGITITALLTDNGSAYRSRYFAASLDPAITHRRTRPYRPQTNGKVERFNRILNEEWAYARPYTSDTQRAATYPAFLHNYNHHRPHSALGYQPPATRVPNLTGQHS